SRPPASPPIGAQVYGPVASVRGRICTCADLVGDPFRPLTSPGSVGILAAPRRDFTRIPVRDPHPAGAMSQDYPYNARLSRWDEIAEGLAIVGVQALETPFPFEPGQYGTLGLMGPEGKLIQRPLAISS